VELDNLTAADFRRILREPKDALVTQYKALMETENVELTLTEDAVAAIADIAFELNQTTENIGARRLTTVMERLVEDISFEADQLKGQTVVIDKAYVDDHLQEIVKDPDLSRYIL
jgi:ATP-dependent HslUV protease ATP-binding subunit HslU